MLALILPRRLRQQPQYAAQIDTSNPLARGLIEGFNAATSSYFGKINSPVLPFSSPGRAYDGRHGAAVCRPEGSTSTPLIDVGSGLTTNTSQTMLTIFVPHQTTTGVGNIATLGSTNNAHNWGFDLGDGVNLVLRGRTHWNGAVMFGGSFNLAGVTTPQVGVIRSIANGESSVWLNGQKDPVTASYTSGSLSVSWFGHYYLYPNHKLFLTLLWNRALSDAEIAQVSADPYQLFKAPEPVISTASALATTGGTTSSGSASGVATVDGKAGFTATATAAATASGAANVAGAAAGSATVAGTSGSAGTAVSAILVLGTAGETGTASGSATVSGFNGLASNGSASGQATVQGAVGFAPNAYGSVNVQGIRGFEADASGTSTAGAFTMNGSSATASGTSAVQGAAGLAPSLSGTSSVQGAVGFTGIIAGSSDMVANLGNFTTGSAVGTGSVRGAMGFAPTALGYGNAVAKTGVVSNARHVVEYPLSDNLAFPLDDAGESLTLSS